MASAQEYANYISGQRRIRARRDAGDISQEEAMRQNSQNNDIPVGKGISKFKPNGPRFNAGPTSVMRNVGSQVGSSVMGGIRGVGRAIGGNIYDAGVSSGRGVSRAADVLWRGTDAMIPDASAAPAQTDQQAQPVQPVSNPSGISSMLRLNPADMGIPNSPTPLPAVPGSQIPASLTPRTGVLVGGRPWDGGARSPTDPVYGQASATRTGVGRDGVRRTVQVGRMTGAEAANAARLAAYEDERNVTGTPGLGGKFIARYSPDQAPGKSGVIGPAPIDHAAVLANQRAGQGILQRAAPQGRYAQQIALAREQMAQQERMAGNALGSQERVARYGVRSRMQNDEAKRRNALEVQDRRNQGVIAAAAARGQAKRNTPEEQAILGELKALDKQWAETEIPILPDDPDETEQQLFDQQMKRFKQLRQKRENAQTRLSELGKTAGGGVRPGSGAAPTAQLPEDQANDGDEVEDEDGNRYVIQNGEPVPVNG